MDDLVVWLRAQLDEDERVASACADAFLQGDRIGIEGERLHPSVRMHTYTWTPARVLREVEAKRGILSQHPFEQGVVGGVCGRCHGQGRIEVLWDGEEETVEHVDEEMIWPCPTVRWLAAVYVDRDGFRDEWEAWRP